MCRNHARPDLGEWYTSAWFSFPYLEFNTNDLQRSIACNIWDPAIGVINRFLPCHLHSIMAGPHKIDYIKDVKQAQRVNCCQSKFDTKIIC